MQEYRIVGTFNVTTTKMPNGSDKLRIESEKRPVKTLQSYKPLDITAFYSSYQPINIYSTYSEYRGSIWGRIRLEAGNIWPDWDGQRVIIEASAHRVIYYKHGGESSRRIYLQHPAGFITDVTTNTFLRKSAQRTRLTKRLAEWEVHFLTGFFAGSHWVGLVSVIGSDILAQVIGERKRNTAYREAAKDIVDVDKDLKGIAPVLRKKLLEALIGGASSKPGEKVRTFIQTLPELVIKDDKTTGRIAGAIAAKYLVNPKNKKLTWFFIFETIISQLAIKSAGKAPKALGATFKESFDQLMPDLEHLDPANPHDQQMLVQHLVRTLNELGVSVTPGEAMAIMAEVHEHPARIASDMEKLGKAFEKLSKAGKQ